MITGVKNHRIKFYSTVVWMVSILPLMSNSLVFFPGLWSRFQGPQLRLESPSPLGLYSFFLSLARSFILFSLYGPLEWQNLGYATKLQLLLLLQFFPGLLRVIMALSQAWGKIALLISLLYLTFCHSVLKFVIFSVFLNLGPCFPYLLCEFI